MGGEEGRGGEGGGKWWGRLKAFGRTRNIEEGGRDGGREVVEGVTED